MVEANSPFIDKMKKAFEEEKNADIEVHVGDKVFKVMKSMLTIHSPIFHAMFEHDTEEKRTNIVKIKGHKSEIVEKFLLYFYTGTVENLNEIASEMFSMADYYQVNDLRRITLDKIYANLTTKTVLASFEVAEKFMLNDLKQKAIKFMNSNINTKTMAEFYELSMKHNLTEILDKISIFIKENADTATKSNEWEKFDAKFQSIALKSFAQQLLTSENDKLLKKELSLTIEKKTDHPNVQQLVGGISNQTCYVKSFLLKKKATKRLAFKIGLDGFMSSYFKSETRGGFIEPGKECTIKITSSLSYITAFVSYEASDKERLTKCFKADAFVRQVPFVFK